MRKPFLPFAFALALTVLAGCDSSEERAEKHYQSGLAYLELGDVDRALVEFRNVFQLNGSHKEARRSYAEVERARGDRREAFSQYLRLVEQYPDDIPALIALSEIATTSGDFERGEEYASKALVKAPDMPELLALKAASDYGLARNGNDVDAQIDAISRIRDLRKTLPDNLILRGMIIDDLIQAKNYQSALDELNSAIDLNPGDADLHAHRLSVLAAMSDAEGVEAALIEMIGRFPDQPEMSEALVRWYASRGETDKAEDFLRGRVAASDGSELAVFELVRFLSAERGPEAALVELDRTIAAGNSGPSIRAARAGYVFDAGRTDEAIAEMEEVLADAKTSEETQRIKVNLARMVTAVGNSVRARALVEEVLAEDPSNTEALKLKGAWLIDDDDVGDAISVLRQALDHDPRDAATMTLMAQAYERDGNRDLMREMLGLAAEASHRAPLESLRYARFLASEGKLVPAENALVEALRISPGNPELLVPLGQLYLQMQDWPRATQVARALEESDSGASVTAAATLRASIFAAQEKSDEAVTYLQGLVDEGKADLGAKVTILRTHIAEGRVDKALAYSSQLLADDPDNPDLRFVDASVRALAGETDAAESAYHALLAEDADRLPVWLALIRLVSAIPEREAEAVALIDEGLAAVPDSPDLKWAKAGYLENAGDIDGAIEIYEALYKENSGNPIVANNLASLLSNYRTDDQSLRRAEVIARRLRGSNVPPYQDTSGWIAYQQGNYSEALAELTPAAAVLTDDPGTQYHLAMTYLALGRKTDAMAQFKKVLDLVPADDSRAFVQSARDEFARLETEGVVLDN
ncbi:MAG: tetratricopeptide repeat protein [Paracoccaceae bacterium]